MSQPILALSAAERAMRGSTAGLAAYLGDISRSNWPELKVAFLDVRPHLPLPGETEDESKARQLRADDAVYKLMVEHSGIAEADLHRHTRKLAAHTRKSLIPEDLGGVAPVMGVASGVDQMLETIIVRSKGDHTADVHVVTLDAGVCSHCAPPSERTPAMSCDFTNPEQVRREQMVRYLIGMHELGHAVERADYLTNDIYKKSSQPLSTGNVYESHADTWMALMAIKELGPEGRAGAIAFMADRAGPERSNNHYTTPSFNAAIAWADANPAALKAASPKELLSRAAEIVSANILSAAELSQILDFKKQLNETITMGGIGKLDGVLSAPLSPAVTRYAETSSTREIDMGNALSAMQKLNPLGDAEWHADTAKKTAECKGARPNSPSN